MDTGLGQAECQGLGTEWKVLTNEVSKVESRKYLEEGQQGSGGRLHPFPPMVAGAPQLFSIGDGTPGSHLPDRSGCCVRGLGPLARMQEQAIKLTTGGVRRAQLGDR